MAGIAGALEAFAGAAGAAVVVVYARRPGRRPCVGVAAEIPCGDDLAAEATGFGVSFESLGHGLIAALRLPPGDRGAGCRGSSGHGLA